MIGGFIILTWRKRLKGDVILFVQIFEGLVLFFEEFYVCVHLQRFRSSTKGKKLKGGSVCMCSVTQPDFGLKLGPTFFLIELSKNRLPCHVQEVMV